MYSHDLRGAVCRPHIQYIDLLRHDPSLTTDTNFSRQSSAGAPVPGAITLRAGAAVGPAPPNIADNMSPKGLAC